jgi:Tol biopolymer transport system component
MHRVIRRASVAGGALAAMLFAATMASALVPTGPRIAFFRLREKPGALELITTAPHGGEERTLAGGGTRVRPLPYIFDTPAWSPDGTSIAFAGWPGKPPADGSLGTRIFIAGADGSGLSRVPGTTNAFSPVFAPDGGSLAYARVRQVGSSQHPSEGQVTRETSTWIFDLSTGMAHLLTPWRRNLQVTPDSFSPDGRVLALTRQRGPHDPEVVTFSLDGSGSAVLIRNGADAVYSPSGGEVVFLRPHKRVQAHRPSHSKRAAVETTTDLFVMNADGSAVRRITDTPGQVELWPSWDPSGKVLLYTRFRGGTEAGIFGLGDTIVETNADGTCPTRLPAGYGTAFYGATWQPGPGREAGLLAC